MLFKIQYFEQHIAYKRQTKYKDFINAIYIIQQPTIFRK